MLKNTPIYKQNNTTKTMKKVFLSLALCSIALAASAQLKSVDATYDYLHDTGIGAGVTFGVGEWIEGADAFELAPRATLYLPSEGACFTLGADIHYLLPEFVEKLEIYPLSGLGFYHSSYTDYYRDSQQNLKKRNVSDNTLLFDIGGGARYHFHDNWAGFAEEKFQIVDGDIYNFFTVGISYTF